MKSKLLSFILAALLFAVLTGIFIAGNFAMFIVAYIFLFAIMLLRSLYAAATVHIRLLYIGTYVSIMILQIIYTTLVTFQYEESSTAFTLLKLTSTRDPVGAANHRKAVLY